MQSIPKILALDIGTVRIGLAVSDGLGLFAHPLATIKWQGKKKLTEKLSEIIKEKSISKIVIGLPITMKGTESIQTKNVLKIIDFLSESIDIPIDKIDERLTTKLAENILKNVNKKASKNKDIIDQVAAVNILQTYLDKNRI